MNYSALLGIHHPDLIGIKATFDGNRQYSFICPKGIYENLEVGSQIVVERQDGTLSVVKVSDLNPESPFDVNSRFNYCFVIQRVADSRLEKLQGLRDRFTKKIKSLEEKAESQEYLDKIGITSVEHFLKSL